MRIRSSVALAGLLLAVPATADTVSPSDEIPAIEAGATSTDSGMDLLRSVLIVPESDAGSAFATPGNGGEFTLVGRINYEVAPGDTLGAIASEYGVSVSDLRRWNDLDNDMIVVGQELTIRIRGGSGERRREEYVVRSGDTGGAIARRHGVTVGQLDRWNPSVNIDRLRIGQELTIYVDGGEGGSSGAPNRGRLRGGIQLTDGVGYRVRNSERSYGTPETISAIRNGIARVNARYLTQPDIVIGDISYERGGPIGQHRSHQNGLDADISFYRVGVDEECPYDEVEPEDIDVERQWYLFRTWIDQGLVQYLFVNFDLQEPLYEYARERGATDSQLEDWFEYPDRGSGGIIRHEPGHDDHFHVRFWPEPEDDES